MLFGAILPGIGLGSINHGLIRKVLIPKFIPRMYSSRDIVLMVVNKVRSTSLVKLFWGPLIVIESKRMPTKIKDIAELATMPTMFGMICIIPGT